MCGMAQSPINDSLVVTLPNSVRVGSQTLDAGEYTIRQLSSSSNSRLLEFSTNKGTSIQASATSIPALDNNNRNESSVLLVESAGISQLHRIWVKGKSYGYEFPVEKENNNVATASNSGMRLTATYSAPPTATATLGSTPAREEEVAAVAAPATAPPGRPQLAEADPAPQAAQSAVQAAEPAASQFEPKNDVAAQSTPEMPKTALHWMTMVLSGLGMFSIGLLIRTYTQRF